MSDRIAVARPPGKVRVGHAREIYVIFDGKDRRVFDLNGLNARLDIDILNSQGTPVFEFQWMFGPQAAKGDPYNQALLALAEAMTRQPNGLGWPDNPGDIPAGYTYLGQFIAHDMTHLQLDQQGSPFSVSNPQLDLDGLFDPPSPVTSCTPGSFMATGCTEAAAPLGPFPHDLPRDSAGKARIADERNDDLLPLAQMHQLMIRFANRVEAANPGWGNELVKQTVIQHYQSVVLHDYLKTLVHPGVYDDVINNGGRKAFLPNGLATGQALRLPIEFAAAAFRFGHSMVRDSYSWNRLHSASLAQFWRFTHSSRGPNEPPMKELPSEWIINWKHFFPLSAAALAGEACNVVKANKIDTVITQLLGTIPPEALENSTVTVNLAQRTLSRSQSLMIADAQTAIAWFNAILPQASQIPELTAQEIIAGEPAAIQDALRLSECLLARSTPLWFYVLKEAKLCGGNQLGKLGSRIVMETIHAVLEYSAYSILDGTWQPSLPFADSKFRMSDVLAYTRDLNPVTGCHP